MSSPIAFDAFVPHYDEDRDRDCPGFTTFEMGDMDGACATCGARTGWVAGAAHERARLNRALTDYPYRPAVDLATQRATRAALSASTTTEGDPT